MTEDVVTMAGNPMRPRDWRHIRAKTLALSSLKTRCGSGDDTCVREAVKFYRKYRDQVDDLTSNASTKIDRDIAYDMMYPSWPAMATALKIYAANSFTKWSTEALVLADIPSEDIASRFGCEAAVVETYEALYYDVRSRLNNRLFIIDELLSPAVINGMHGDDCDFVWKSLSYCRGAAMLEACWQMGSISSETHRQIEDFLLSQRNRNLIMAAVARKVNQYTAHEFVEEDIAYKQLEQDSGIAQAPHDRVLAEGASMLLTAISFSMTGVPGASVSAIEERAKSLNQLLEPKGKTIEGVGITSDEPSVFQQRLRRKEAADAKALETVITTVQTGVEPEASGAGTTLADIDKGNAVRLEHARKKIERKKDLLLTRIRAKRTKNTSTGGSQ